MISIGILLVFALPASRQPVLAGSATGYTVTDLGSIGGLVPTITGINAAGQLSGYVSGSAGQRAVRYTAGAWQYVPGLENTISVATGINVHGDLSGYEFTSAGPRAFRYSDASGVTVFPDPLPGGSMTLGMAINDNGAVVGYGNTATGMQGWLAAAGSTTLTPLPFLPGGTIAQACGINNTGAIVGSSTTSAGTSHAYRIDSGNTTVDAGSLDGAAGFSVACAIDDNGRIAGDSSSAGNEQAFRFDAGTPVDIDSFGSPFSTVKSVSAGVSVGFYTTSSGDSHAFVQSGTDPAVDLNTLVSANGWVLSEALAVNVNGAIAGDGLLNGAQADFLLTPGQSDTTPPVINSVAPATPNIWPPDNKMVSVTISVSATDNVDPTPACAVTSISGSSSDAAITGPLSVSVRASNGNVYTATVTCRDAAGNKSTATTSVSITKDPSTILKPKGRGGLTEAENRLRHHDRDDDGHSGRGGKHDGRGDDHDGRGDHRG